MPKTVRKDPDAILDYVYDWSLWLGEDSINTVQTVVTPVADELTVDEPRTSIADGKVTIWVESGILNKIYDVICRIVTANGRTDDRTIRFKIVSK